MSSPPSRRDGKGRTGFGWVVLVVGTGVILAEIGGAYVVLASSNVSTVAVYGGTAAIAIVVGGSSLYVASRRAVGSGSPNDSSDESGLTRVAEVIVSVSVLTAVTVLLGSIGGLGLTVLAKLGGPDPKTADGELLRNRLLDWVQRNRDFMRANGRGELPLKP